MNLNVDLNNLLPTPNLGSTQGSTPVTSHPRTEEQISDTLTTSTSTSTTTTINLEADNPMPTQVREEGMEALLKLGTGSATTGPGGPGGLANPWFKANPTVAFTLAFLEYYNALRENKTVMGELLVQQIGTNMDLAKSAAELAMAAAEKEREGYIADAIVAGVQAGVALVGTAISVYSLAKSLKASSVEIDDAQKEVDAKKAGVDKAQEKLAEAQANYNKKLELAADKQPVPGAEQSGTDSNITNRKTTTGANSTLEDKLAEAKEAVTERKKDFERAEDAHTRAQDQVATAERRYLDFYEKLTAITQQAAQMISKAADAGGSGFKAELAIKKGAIQAAQQILQGQQEILRRINESISQSYANTSDSMNQLIQSLKKMEDELVRAMSMTRN